MGGSGLSDDGWPAFSPAPPDPGVQESSVDWHSEGPAVYGSGQAVEQPTADEYDAWMSQLNLGGASSPEPQESSGSVAPFFGDDLSGLEAFSFDSDPGTDAGSADFGSGSAFDQNPFAASSAWDASEPAAGAPAGPSAWDANDPAFGAPGDTGGFGTVFGAETESAFDPVFGSELDAASEQSFSFGDDEDDESGDFDWAGRLGASSAPPAAPASPRMSPTSPSPVSPAPARSPSAPVFAASQPTQARAEDYFRYIPPDIEPASSGLDRSGVLLLASVVGLVLLNLVSLGLLVANLLG